MNLSLVGVSHHGTRIELRERVAVDRDGSGALARALAGDCEAVVLSTCNRTELYLASDDAVGLERKAEQALSELAGDRSLELAPAVYHLADESAALHLFRVAAGLDSMVPGEGEILGQVRDAFEAGATGPLLDRLFRMALHVGRRARVETAIGESPASVPAAAGALAQQVFDSLKGRKVVLIGAGRTIDLTARNLRSRGAVVIAVANRTLEHAEDLVGRQGGRAISLDDVPGQLADADLVVSATAAPGLVLRGDAAAAVLRARRGRPLLFIDLAVPRDLDPALGSFDGCFLYDVDDLEAVVEASLVGRRAEAVHAERIVALEAERFREWQAALAVVPAITSLRERAEAIRSSELERAEGRLASLSENERRTVEAVTAQIVGKLLHLPTVRLKEAAVRPDGVVYARVVRHLFGLGEEDRS